jgi:hypothetical protein
MKAKCETCKGRGTVRRDTCPDCKGMGVPPITDEERASHPAKCEISIKGFKPCILMDRYLTEGWNAGLSKLDGIRFSDLQYACYGVTYKTSRADRGMIVNYCPWCGARIRVERSEIETEPEQVVAG